MKKYSILSNYIYIYRFIRKLDHSLLPLTFLEITIGALLPLLSAWLPALIIGVLESGSDTFTLIKTCVLAFLLSALIHGLSKFLYQRNWFQYIFIRNGAFWNDMMMKSLTIDYALSESEDLKRFENKAMSSLSNNHTGVEGFMHSNVKLFTALLGLSLYIIIISSVHPLFVVMLLFLSLLQYLFYIIAVRYERKHKNEQSTRQRHQRYLFSMAYDVKGGKDIRLYQSHNWIIALFENYNKQYQRQLSKEKGFYYLYDFVGLILQLIRDGACYGYLLYLLTQGMSVSEFVLYLGLVSSFGNWFASISEMLANVSRDSLMISDYRRFMDVEDIYRHGSGERLQECHDGLDIVFEDVCFAYPNSERLVLDHLSFHLKKNEKLALVGINGAGKTTLVKLLCGFYKPTSGRILINGLNINDLDIDDYFNHCSVLFQDAILLSYTIAQNITGEYTLSNPERFRDALHKSGLYEKIESLPKKENTCLNKDIDEDGIQLSGGQIQKLFLARALYKNADLLILDEPTAALDAIAESEMYERYHELVHSKTSIFISHRLSSTRFCERIFFLENGRIKEEGTHDELMSLHGAYANMFQIQRQYYQEEGENNENTPVLA